MSDTYSLQFECESDSPNELIDRILNRKDTKHDLVNSNLIEIKDLIHSETLQFDGSDHVSMILSWSLSIAISVVANVLYDIVKHYVKKVTFNGRRVTISEEGFNAALKSIEQRLSAIDKY